MTRRHPNPWTQQEAPKGLPGDRARRRKDPLLPSVPLPQIRGVSGAGATRGSRASGSDDGWWGGSSLPELGVGVRSSPLSLPTLPTGAQRAAQNRAKLRSLPLPPLRRAGAPRDPAPRPGESEDPCRGSARETPDSLLALQGELLPSKFREFLQRTGTECVRATPPTSSARQSKKSVSEHCQHLPRCPHCSFPSDLRGQSSYFQISLKKILLRRIPALGTLKRDRSQFITFKKANQPHGVQAPKLKAVLTHSSSGEGSGKKRRRFCPFRVRFADETLRDSALRYWERALAVRQGHIEKGIATGSMTSERVFRSVGRWLESLPKALCPRAQEEAMASISFGWDCPGLAPQEPQGHLSEDASMKSSLPFIPRATTQRPQSGLKTFLEAHSILEQVDRSPSSWSQKLESFLPSVALVLNRGRPKGSCLL
ncbi:uncharacterized protein C9orf50 homolog isoform X2 [Acinonyx jubatus]|uniref:Uncharacterized protein C9orf50 homolog isoform X2 n=1 Tax=Acinonyx jubatus TaxID=32536 RepID=A0ABM3NM62_ACIJB|nr:uncharacterized protein C9orf50 homolog isoform X2 [Acinonyx jubatus]